MGEALVLRGVSAGYGARVVVRDLSAELPVAGLTVILGPGGSGKSTLLRLLDGPGPELWWSGEIPRASTWRLSQSTRSDRHLAIDAALFESERAAVGAWLARHPRVLTSSQRAALFDNARVVARLGQILSATADTLLLDEPDAEVPELVRPILVPMLRERAHAGVTVVLVTHNLALAECVADHAVLLVDGVKLDEGPLARLRARPASKRVRDFFTWGA
jgi:ABC-type multidrug transport system ATPase subunit